MLFFGLYMLHIYVVNVHVYAHLMSIYARRYMLLQEHIRGMVSTYMCIFEHICDVDICSLSPLLMMADHIWLAIY